MTPFLSPLERITLARSSFNLIALLMMRGDFESGICWPCEFGRESYCEPSELKWRAAPPYWVLYILSANGQSAVRLVKPTPPLGLSVVGWKLLSIGASSSLISTFCEGKMSSIASLEFMSCWELMTWSRAGLIGTLDLDICFSWNLLLPSLPFEISGRSMSGGDLSVECWNKESPVWL